MAEEGSGTTKEKKGIGDKMFSVLRSGSSLMAEFKKLVIKKLSNSSAIAYLQESAKKQKELIDKVKAKLAEIKDKPASDVALGVTEEHDLERITDLNGEERKQLRLLTYHKTPDTTVDALKTIPDESFKEKRDGALFSYVEAKLNEVKAQLEGFKSNVPLFAAIVGVEAAEAERYIGKLLEKLEDPTVMQDEAWKDIVLDNETPPEETLEKAMGHLEKAVGEQKNSVKLFRFYKTIALVNEAIEDISKIIDEEKAVSHFDSLLENLGKLEGEPLKALVAIVFSNQSNDEMVRDITKHLEENIPNQEERYFTQYFEKVDEIYGYIKGELEKVKSNYQHFAEMFAIEEQQLEKHLQVLSETMDQLELSQKKELMEIYHDKNISENDIFMYRMRFLETLSKEQNQGYFTTYCKGIEEVKAQLQAYKEDNTISQCMGCSDNLVKQHTDKLESLLKDLKPEVQGQLAKIFREASSPEEAVQEVIKYLEKISTEDETQRYFTKYYNKGIEIEKIKNELNTYKENTDISNCIKCSDDKVESHIDDLESSLNNLKPEEQGELVKIFREASSPEEAVQEAIMCLEKISTEDETQQYFTMYFEGDIVHMRFGQLPEMRSTGKYGSQKNDEFGPSQSRKKDRNEVSRRKRGNNWM